MVLKSQERSKFHNSIASRSMHRQVKNGDPWSTCLAKSFESVHLLLTVLCINGLLSCARAEGYPSPASGLSDAVLGVLIVSTLAALAGLMTFIFFRRRSMNRRPVYSVTVQKSICEEGRE